VTPSSIRTDPKKLLEAHGSPGGILHFRQREKGVAFRVPARRRALSRQSSRPSQRRRVSWRIHRITRPSVSGTARDSASASDTKQSLSATQVRQNLAGGPLSPSASGAHGNTFETLADSPPDLRLSRIMFDPGTLSLGFPPAAPQRDAITARKVRIIKGRPYSIGVAISSVLMEGAVCMNSKKYVGMDVHQATISRSSRQQWEADYGVDP
jgi:hypothetical protein